MNNQDQVTEVVSNNVAEYFANSITSTDFIENHIKPISSVSEEQEEKICQILKESQQDWDSAECDAEGATQEQNKALDLIIYKCATEISHLF